MADNVSMKRIYTNLDSLFDTELAFLDLIDSRLSREYYTDEYDIDGNYLYMSYRNFMTLFKDRDKRILKLAKSTSVSDLIRNIINDMDIKRKDGTYPTTKIVLYINTYPYKLDDDEVKELHDFYKRYFLFVDDVEIIHKEELSKSFIDKINVLIDRYGMSWFLDMKMKHIVFRFPHVRLIIPDKFYNDHSIRKNNIDTGKMIEYLQTTLMTDIRLDIIEKETFMLKVSTDKEE